MKFLKIISTQQNARSDKPTIYAQRRRRQISNFAITVTTVIHCAIYGHIHPTATEGIGIHTHIRMAAGRGCVHSKSATFGYVEVGMHRGYKHHSAHSSQSIVVW